MPREKNPTPAPNESALPVSIQWISDLNVARYRPMIRLLDDEDLRAMRLLPGYSRAMERGIRRQRYAIFAAYLRCMRLDFERLSAGLKVLIAQSPHDRPQLASSLVQSRL